MSQNNQGPQPLRHTSGDLNLGRLHHSDRDGDCGLLAHGNLPPYRQQPTPLTHHHSYSKASQNQRSPKGPSVRQSLNGNVSVRAHAATQRPLRTVDRLHQRESAPA